MTNDEKPKSLEPLENLAVPSFDELSDQQQRLIIEGPGWVTDPAEQSQFDSLDDFRWSSNNFNLRFRPVDEDGIPEIPYLYRQQLACQRFRILQPELFEELVSTLPDAQHRQDDKWQAKLFTAYRYMSQLVDKRDSDYLKEGESDRFLMI